VRRALASALAVFAIFVGVALSAATPVTPAPGATVASAHPLFSWSLPANEQAQAVYIATKPDRTPEGRFYEENLVDVGLLANDAHQWSPTSPLYAGYYWWLVWSTDRSTYDSYFSSPVSFTIPVALNLLSIKVRRYTGLGWLGITVRYTANVKDGPLVSVRLLRRGRLLWRDSEGGFAAIGSAGSSYFNWYGSRRVKRGTRLTLQATIRAGGVKRARLLAVRAP
jgi:hypothetical protein